MDRLLRDLAAALRAGPQAGDLLTDPAARSVYARDASHIAHGRPLAIALPRSAAQLAAVVDVCARHGVPFVARGAGTGLSGGALPGDGAVVISTARLAAIEPVDAAGRRVRVGPGAINEAVSRAAASSGLLFAPDPGSQAASTIGGNVAENAGGPHTLKVGVTLQHLLRLDWVDARGRALTTGPGLAWERGYDLLALLCGSEGTLGVVTGADLRLVPAPAAVATLLGIFPRLDDATRAVVALLGRGLLPAAVEMVDQPMLRAVEQAFRFGFPTDVEAALIVEFDGAPEAVAQDAALAEPLLREQGAREVRRAASAAERDDLWRCRKKAFGAVGRLAPNYVTMDVCVPLGRLPEIAHATGTIAAAHRVGIATTVHAGDGNLHPGVHYDARDPDQTARAHAAADAIIAEAVRLGGSVTGEHGVGLEKLHVLGLQVDRNAAALMRGLKRLFDPAGLCNPGKALVPEQAAARAGGAAATPREPPPPPAAVEFQWDSLTVTAPAEASLADLQAEALARGFWVPLGAVRSPGGAGSGLGAVASVGDLIDLGVPGPSMLGRGTARDFLLELWAETGAGLPFHAGAPVGKNVAGYDLARLVLGSGGTLARPRGATFQLKPAPRLVALWQFHGGEAAPDLAAVLRVLSAWPTDLAAPICLGEREPWTITILAGGRENDELDRREGELSAWAAATGLVRSARERGPFAQVASPIAPPLPAWAGSSPDWTCLQRRPADIQGPPAQGEPLAHELPDRFVWQAAPALLWAPRAVDAAHVPAGWHAQAIWRDGRPAELPAPADPGMSVDLLAGIKALFDPGDRLPRPGWLPYPEGAGR